MSTRYRITTPVLDFTGVVGNCTFAKGAYEGPVEDGPLAYFTAQGYGVEEITADAEPAAEVADHDAATRPPGNASAEAWRTYLLTLPGVTEDQVKDMSRDQLRELADKLTQEGQGA